MNTLWEVVQSEVLEHCRCAYTSSLLQVLENILGFLHPIDRLDSALTCRTWAEAVSSAPLLEDIWLVIRGPAMEMISSAVIESQRRYRNLRVVRGI